MFALMRYEEELQGPDDPYILLKQMHGTARSCGGYAQSFEPVGPRQSQIDSGMGYEGLAD